MKLYLQIATFLALGIGDIWFYHFEESMAEPTTSYMFEEEISIE